PGTAPTLGADDKSQPGSTDSGSPIPTESPKSGKSTTREARGKSTGKPTQQSSTVPVDSSTPGKSTTREAGGKSTGKPTQQSSTVPVDSSTPGFLSLSEEDCDAMDVEVQVMYVGNNKLETADEKAAYLRQVQDMLRPYVPCRKLEPTDSQRKKRG
ncbi:uncharacterized protein LOC144485968, partial [Mustelus asterias]